jgi:preprotein translocase subunit SecF
MNLSRIDYMKSARIWVYASITLTVLSLIVLSTVGLNKGIDFTGGMQFDVQYSGDVTQAAVTTATEKVSAHPQVQKAVAKTAGESSFLVTTPELNADQKTALVKDLTAVGNGFKLLGENHVSGSVSTELTKKALMAIAIAAILQIIYIWIRFDLKFGITAVVAVLHDVTITLGVISILRIQINSPFVAAVLTILGYSLNDSVVVIDRIRENLPKRGKNESLAQLVTRSMQEVIHRSLYTVTTVLMTLLALILFGGESIRDFVLTMFIGMTLGAYSSIFICSALWLFWSQYEEKHGKVIGKGSNQKGKLKPSRA